MCIRRSDRLPSSLWKIDKSSCFDVESREIKLQRTNYDVLF